MNDKMVNEVVQKEPVEDIPEFLQRTRREEKEEIFVQEVNDEGAAA